MTRKEPDRLDFGAWTDTEDDFRTALLAARNSVAYWVMQDRLTPLTDRELVGHISEAGNIIAELLDLQRALLVALNLRTIDRERHSAEESQS